MSKSPKGNPKANRVSKSELRIIGGQWRGRRLTFTAEEGLRPTLDRYRETLFNWLMFDVEGARCLDLFAGSGALGLEALSRGARHVDFVDASAQAAQAIREHLQTLSCQDARVHHRAAEAWLKQQANTKVEPYDLIFLDPPFHQDLLQPCLYLLEYKGFIKPETKIYLEAEGEFLPSRLPGHWQVLKQKNAKNKIFFLLECPTPHPD
ncbi:MAG: 16S rRNA (guanine(966)-N(2))-methyltransferase RsmD [Pseudomonadales bacterium]|nr:16S rRNA (guanine(966)-N(2))-methyltransferase RsmD [Pseudomonadales bacterium]